MDPTGEGPDDGTAAADDGPLSSFWNSHINVTPSWVSWASIEAGMRRLDEMAKLPVNYGVALHPREYARRMTTPKKVAAPKAKAAPKAVTAVDDPALAEQAADDAATGDELDEASQADAAPDAGAASGVEGAPPEITGTIDAVLEADTLGGPEAVVPFPEAEDKFPVGPRDVVLPDSFDRAVVAPAEETTPERPFPVMPDPVRIPPTVY